MNEYIKPEKVWNRGFAMIFVANFLHNMGQQTISTLVPKYSAILGATSTVIGIVSGIFAVSSLVIKPFASPAFDCCRKKILYVGSNSVILLSYLLFFLAPNVVWIIAGRLLQGFGIGIAAPMGLSIACDNLPEGKFARGVSVFSLGQALGQAVGPSIGLALSKSIGYRLTFLVCIGFMVGCVASGLFVNGNAPDPDAEYRIRPDNIVAREALPASLTMVFVIAAYSCINGFLPIYGELLGIGNIGLYFTVYAVSIFVIRLITGGLADRFGYARILIPSLCCFALAFFLFSKAKTLPLFLAAAVFAALGYGICQPNLQAMCMSAVPENRRGVGSNTFFLGQDIGMFLGPYLAGMIADSLILKGCPEGIEYASDAVKIDAYSGMFLAIIANLAIAAALILILSKRKKRI